MKSKKPRKQRKFMYKAPLHIKRKILASSLSKELRDKFKRGSLSIRKGDEVVVTDGKFKGRTGKVAKVNYKKYLVFVDGVTRKRTVGTEAQVSLHPSNLRIVSLNLDDKRRTKILERKGVKVTSVEEPKGA